MVAPTASPNRIARSTAPLVQDRQHARQRDVDGGGLRVGRGAECRRGARKDLRCRRQLRVRFQADDDFPVRHHATSFGASMGAPSVPVGRLLIPVRDVQDLRLAEIIPLHLQPDGQAAPVEATGNRHRRRAGQVAGDGEDVVQVHLHRIVGLGADLECRRRRRRAHDDVALFIGALEVVGDQPPDLLRLQVVRVVIAVRQHVGAHEDAPLHLGAEALGARLLVHVHQVRVLLRAMAVADAVEPRQVGRRLRRRDHVVDGDGQVDVRQRDVDRRGAQFAEFGERRVDGRGDVGIDAAAEIFGGQADAQALRADPDRFARVVLARPVERCRVARVVARHRIEHEPAVFRGAREHAGRVQARREGDQAVARAHAIGGLQAADARQRRRLADRATRVGARGARHQARGHRGGRAARASARNVFGVPRVLHRAEVRRLVGGAHRELVHVRLADQDGAGVLQALDDERVVRRREVRQHARAAGGRQARGHDHVLVRDRHAGERWRVALRQRLVRGARLRQRAVGIDGHERVERALCRVDAGQHRARQLDARQLLRAQRRGDLRQRAGDDDRSLDYPRYQV